MDELKFTLKPLKELSKGTRRYSSKYDPVLDQFMESGHELVEVALESSNLSGVRTALKKRIEKRNLKDRVEVGIRGGVLYLKRI